MTEIRRQIAAARRRLMIQAFLGRLVWLLTGGLALAVAALVVMKVIALPAWTGEVASVAWTAGWIGGAVGLAFVIAVGWTYLARRPSVDTAIEIDRRYGLRERVSSAVTLAERERETEAGRAVIADAERSVAGIDVSDEFPVRINWPALIPVLTAIALIVLVFVPNATPSAAAAKLPTLTPVQEKLKEPTEVLRRKIEQARADAEERGLKEAEVFFKDLRKGVDKLNSKEAAEKKDALIDLNQLKKSLDERRKQLGDPAEIKKQLEQMEGNAEQGPAEKINKALAKGDFQEAAKQLESLQQRMDKGELSEKEQEQLAKQAEQMAEKMADLAADHEQTKQKLEDQIEQMKRAGNQEGAADLQKKLEDLARNDGAMQKMSEMANKLQKASDALKSGDQKAAAKQLSDMQNELSDMAEQMQEGESLDEIADQLAECKECLGDKPGDKDGEGEGDGPPQFGQSMSQGQGEGEGDGLGEGQGRGNRPEDKNDTGSYDTQVRAQPKPGEAVRVGDAFGANTKGQGMATAREAIDGASVSDDDPLTQQRLPRGSRDHVKEYMMKVGTGK